MSEKRYLFTICGRAGSKGIKNKNIRDFLGIKLPFYSLAAIDLFLQKNSAIAADVVLNTDSRELMELMKNNRLRPVSILIRKPELSGDNVGKIDVICDSFEQMENTAVRKFDAIIDLDITSPLRTVADMESLVTKYEDKQCDVVFSVTTSRRNPYFNMVKGTPEGYKRILESGYTARQQAPAIYDMNASLYAFRPDFLRKKQSLFDGYCEIVEMYDTGILDLDNEEDFELMEVVAKHLFQTRSEFAQIYSRAKEA